MTGTGSRFLKFAKSEPMLTASAVLCIACVLIVRPSADVCNNIDWTMICTLFCFMCVVSALSELGAFARIAGSVVSGKMDARKLCILLVALPLLCSMFITNDVALITFVPFAMLVLGKIGRRDLMAPVAVLQTLAANTGCMAFPFGSPHNLMVYSHYELGMRDVVSVMLPYLVVGAALIFALCLLVPKDRVEMAKEEKAAVDWLDIGSLAFAFAFCILCVVKVVPCWSMLIVSTGIVLETAPRSLKDVNYGLLLTFVFLFVLIGTLTSVDSVDEAIEGLMDGGPFLPAVGLSQFISNVPAATLLSSFTDDWAGLLAGVNVGGFGTPIASMASVITFGIYAKAEGRDMKRFALMFLGANILMVAVLAAVWAVS